MSTFAIIALILSTLAAVGSGVASYANQKQTNEFNQQQYEDWKSYNTPVNQMSRLTEAGLNPYQVNGVSNTLSQPFSIGQNTGISELLSGASRSLYGSAIAGDKSEIRHEQNAIRYDALKVQRDKLDFEKSFGDLKKQMMQTAIKRGDNQAALFWSSVQQKDIVNQYLKRSLPFRIGKTYYDYLGAQQGYTYNEQMNPLKLRFYAPYERALINNLNRRTSHLDWSEAFDKQRFLANYGLGLKKYHLDVLKNEIAAHYLEKRLQLSNTYENLAETKFLYNLWMEVNRQGISVLPFKGRYK